MLDLDGTTIPNSIDGMPSDRVKNAINAANKKLNVCIVTARPSTWTTHIVDYLKLDSLYIVDNGAQVIDSNTKKVLWERPLRNEDVKHILSIAKKYKCDVTYSDGDSYPVGKNKKIPNKIFNLFFGSISDYQLEKLFEHLEHIPTISVQKIPSWSGGSPVMIVTHAEATKQHGIFEVGKLLKIDTHEIIGVGDGYNDFPLLMACGLKVAMGNAVPDLKEIADYIAPSVDDDGVADVIEKFILTD